MVLKGKKVVIIGAGPVGLTMATLLYKKGVDVVVYERDPGSQARVWGGTLDLHKNSGQAAMKQAELLDRYFSLAKPMGRTVADEYGNVLLSTPPNNDTPEINRNALRKMLLESLPAECVAWDRKFTGIEADAKKWRLHFENKPDVVADVVIGANGGMSKARNYVTSAEAQYTGTLIIQGEVNEPAIKCKEFNKLCNQNILMVAADSKTLVANPDNDGDLTYNVTFRMPQAWLSQNEIDFQRPDNVVEFLSTMFSNWHESYQQLFRATSYFVGLPARKLPLDSSWNADRPFPITLIGDAAHVMPPFAGEGLNIGLIDAMILASNLTDNKFANVEAAISDYETQMFDYAIAAQQQTSTNEIAMHSPGFSFVKRFARQDHFKQQ